MTFLIQSWNFRDYPFTYCLRKSAVHGWDAVELNYCHVDLDGFAEGYSERKREGYRYNLPILVVDIPNDFGDLSATDDDHRRQIERYKRVFSILKGTETRVVNGSIKIGGAGPASDNMTDRAVDRMREVAEAAAAAGITFTVETHLKSLTETAAQTAAFLDRLDSPAVRCCLDLGNLIRAEGAEEPLEAVEMLAGRIGHVHAKNLFRIAGSQRFTSLEEGEIDYARVLSSLYTHGYDGLVAMENGGPGWPGYVTRQDITFLRSTFDDITSGVLR